MRNKLLQPESKFFELIKQNPTPTEEEWAHICKEIQLSESTIRLYTDEVNWCCVSQYQHLSKDFIREFYDKIEWDELSYFGCSAFNEKFFEEFNNDVNWNFILTKQKDKLTEKIIERFESKRICKEIK